ncbi:tripartite tricarboxylate transporter substrate binding protein [Ancylobacter sp. Lp-2]|uniref:Bug family tripartite tricarboxylate transporter substrate binding protein n=1 Tax=Ancylobacter sp. Lp-2 TaxID=2881339 RepID=UPI001E4937A1|nr:tripartite tricarboxylate transporter substrate binding protein [Ancylobacter sp. Lp-2]MCB4771581.1 tripartite tricarboxylate transporter substrate binding protein [Ancylobacter sp. Lp-2]
MTKRTQPDRAPGMQIGSRRTFLAAALTVTGLALLAPSPASAQAYPEPGKRFTIIVAGSAGSGTDINARFVAAAMEKEFPGTSFQVVNRPGAGVQVGVQALADAPKDGYTFGLISLPTAITVMLDPSRKANFNKESFIGIGNFSYDAGAIAVRADSPYKSLGDLIAAAKEKPAERTVGVVGPRGREHLDVIAMEQGAGVSFTPVFHNDSGLALNTLLGGNIDAVQGSVGDFVAQVKSGRVRILAVFDKQESAYAPGVPTAESQGFKIYSGTSRGFAFPAGVDPKMAARIGETLGKIANSPEYKSKFAEMGLEIRYMDAAQYNTYWNGEVARISSLLSKIN